jgi:hypothetical protein
MSRKDWFDMALGAANSVTYILDKLSISSEAAYSLRKLRKAYAGSAIRVRRSSDNAETNIGFKPNGQLDTVALLNHCGVGNGFVTIWYDQSSNSRNMTQISLSLQPQIVSSGAVVTDSGKPTLLFQPTGFLDASFSAINQPFTRCYVVTRKDTTNTGGNGHLVSSASATPNTTDYLKSSSVMSIFAGTVSSGFDQAFSISETAIFSSIYNGASSKISKNGTFGGTADAGSVNFAGVRVGRNLSLPGPVFSCSELIIFSSSISDDNRNLLERNQGKYFSITVA